MDKFINLILSASVNKCKLQEYKILLSCYIICAFVPEIPKAVPMTFGHQGAAKTSLMEFIKTLVDPSAVKTLSFPTDLNEMIQQLSHNYLAFYDNISTLRDRTSDQLCRAVTGSGSSKRVLYSDDDDFIRSFKRCIGINGINLAATKPDLLDRALFFELKRIENKDRRKLEDVWREFEAMAPQLLGYIFNILVKALAWKQTHKKLNLELPRMADWAEWCEIISRSIGNEDGAFLKAFQNNRKIQVEQIIESSQVATCLTYYIDVHPEKFDKIDVDGIPIWGFEGTASELLEILHSLAPSIGIDTRNNWWPKAPNALSRRLNEIAHTLREAGIELEFVKSPDRNRVRTIKIRKVSSISSISSEEEILDPVSTIGRSDGPDDNSGTNKKIIETEIIKENSPPHDSTENFETCDSSNIGNKTGNGSSYNSKIRQEYQSVQNGESKPNSSIESEQTVVSTTNRTSRADVQNKPVKNGTSENTGDPHLFLLTLMLKEIEAANGSIVSVPDILRTVYENNETIRSCLGDKLTQRENRKIRDLFVDIVRHKNIDPVKYKPQLLVRWKPTEDKSTEADP